MIYSLGLAILTGVAGTAYLSVARGASRITQQAAEMAAMERFRQRLVEDVGRCLEISVLPTESGSANRIALKMDSEKLLVWQPLEEGEGVGFSELVEGESINPTEMMRTGNVEFEIQERDGRAVGVIVKVFLSPSVPAQALSFTVFASFSAYRERAP